MKPSWKVPAWWWLLPALLALSVAAQATALFMSKVDSHGNTHADVAGQTQTDAEIPATNPEEADTDGPGIIEGLFGAEEEPYLTEQWPRLFPGVQTMFIVTESGTAYEIDLSLGAPYVGVVPEGAAAISPFSAITSLLALSQDGTAWIGSFGIYSWDQTVEPIPVSDVVQISSGWMNLVRTADGKVYHGSGTLLDVPGSVVDLRANTMTTDAGELYVMSWVDQAVVAKVEGITDARMGCAFDVEDALVVNKAGEIYRWRNYGNPGHMQVEDMHAEAPIVQLSCLPYDDGAVFYSAVDAKGNGYHGMTRTDAGVIAGSDHGGYDEPGVTEWIRMEGIRGATSSTISPGAAAFVTQGEVVVCTTGTSTGLATECTPEPVHLD